MEEIKKNAIKETAKDLIKYIAISLIIVGAIYIMFYLAFTTTWGSILLCVIFGVVIFGSIVGGLYLDNLDNAKAEYESKQRAIKCAEEIKKYIEEGGEAKIGLHYAFVKDKFGMMHTLSYSEKYYELVKNIVYDLGAEVI
jgi:hypothetical protein